VSNKKFQSFASVPELNSKRFSIVLSTLKLLGMKLNFKRNKRRTRRDGVAMLTKITQFRRLSL
jgi:hypothetical protein